MSISKMKKSQINSFTKNTYHGFQFGYNNWDA